jgi:AraC-like DNA-binding protein/quercetin dioxygenase-like cupin family protein
VPKDIEKATGVRQSELELVGRSYGLILGPGAPWRNPPYGWDQILTSHSGEFLLTSQGRCWRISPGFALTIPSGVDHRIVAAGKCDIRALFVKADSLSGFRLISLGPLLKELLLHASLLGALYSGRQRDQALVTLILTDLASSPSLPLQLPWPGSPQLNLAAEALVADPMNPISIADAARIAGISKRTLERRFQAELEMGVAEWQREFRLIKAAHAILAGQKVSDVAFESGYASVSAFTFSFRYRYGTPPSRFKNAPS